MQEHGRWVGYSGYVAFDALCPGASCEAVSVNLISGALSVWRKKVRQQENGKE
jgi:hypothetical protein